MSKTPMDLVNEAKQIIKEVDIDGANALIADGAIALDIRETAEFDAGNIPNSHHIPRGVLEFKIGAHDAFQDKDAPIVIYCKSGGRSALAAVALTQLGYSNVCSMAGGYDEWVQH